MKNVVAFDSETELIRPGKNVPDAVCLTWQRPGFKPDIVHVGGIDDRGGLQLVTSWLESDETLVGHNVCFDMAVLGVKWPYLVPAIFDKYDRDRIACTKIRQQLLDIAAGEFRGHMHEFTKKVDVDGVEVEVRGGRWIVHNYRLADLVYRTNGERMNKGSDTWRLRYAEFKNVPISKWPREAIEYPLKDASSTLEVFEMQEKHVEYIPDQFRQARYAFALQLTASWGLRTREEGVNKLERETLASLAEIEDDLKAVGLVRADGSRNTKAAKARMVEVCCLSNRPVRLTDGGKSGKPQPSLDADACKASGDHILETYSDLTSLKAVLAKDIPMLRAGTVYPVHTSFGMAASGRSTASRPNVQNPRRLPGIREAFVPRPGKVFAVADFSALELHTLAQVCLRLFGHSRLAEQLNANIDPHTAFAAKLAHVSYEEGVRLADEHDHEFINKRQTAKVANFGFPGGLGFESLCFFARKSYKVILTEEEAKQLKADWFENLPEMKDFFRYAGMQVDRDTGVGVLQHLFSERWRGGCHYTSFCNSWFQGLGSDAAKSALYYVVRDCYARPNSVLFGTRPVNFVHDEIIAETEEGPKAHDVAMELGRVMVASANEFLPDVHAKVKPFLARCWSKDAGPVYDADGRLIPWDESMIKKKEKAA